MSVFSCLRGEREEIPPVLEVPKVKVPLRKRAWRGIKWLFRSPKQRAFDRSLPKVIELIDEFHAKKHAKLAAIRERERIVEEALEDIHLMFEVNVENRCLIVTFSFLTPTKDEDKLVVRIDFLQ